MGHNSVREEKFSEKIVKFFCEIFREIENPDNTIFVAVTRKGYWLYKNVEEEVMEKLSQKKRIKVYSDRYVLKDFRFELIKDKEIILFDDSVNNGNNLFFYYVLFLKHQARSVMPLVYAMSTEYLSNMDDDSCPENKYLEYERVYKKKIEAGANEEQIKDKVTETYRKFNSELKYEKIMTASEVSRFSIEQLLMAQACLSPFVMDLPMLRHEKQGDGKYIVFSKQEWEEITEKTKEWEYIPNTYNELDREINCDYFRLSDPVLTEQFEEAFFDFVVKCKHKEDEGNIKAVFVPFAIVKSFAYEDIWQCFSIMYSGTEYFEHVQSIIDAGMEEAEPLEIRAVAFMRLNHNFGRAIMRAVIYYISMYIGGLFKEMIQWQVGKELVLDEEIMDEHNIHQFNNTVKKIWNEFDREKFEHILLQCKRTKKIEPINSEEQFDGERKRADLNDIEQYIHFRTIETKYMKVSMRKKLLTLETIEQEVDFRFLFDSTNEKKAAITRAILLLLETSCIGNEILVDDETGIIYRGFRAGETSEILFRKPFFLIYVYAYALYYLKGVEGYKRNIALLMDYVERLFYQEGYIESVFTEKEFQLYKNYLILMEKPHEQIPSKNYLIDLYVNDSERYGGKIILDKAAENVCEWF